MAFQFTPQWVKPVAWQIEITRAPRLVEVSQYVADTPSLIGSYPAPIIVLEQAFQPLVPKRPYHQNTVPRIGTGVNLPSV
jgi:hypothetical protein